MFVSTITHGNLQKLYNQYRNVKNSLNSKGLNIQKISIKKGFSGLIPADSQIENAYVSR